MTETNEGLPMLRWRSVNQLFTGEPLLVFITDGFDEEWSTVPTDVAAMIETMQSTSSTAVRVFAVDFRVDPDFLDLFELKRGTTVVRRLGGEDTFDVLNTRAGFGELIEFCRAAFESPDPLMTRLAS